MSRLGHSRANWAARIMSGLPPIATGLRTWREVRLVPLSEVIRTCGVAKTTIVRRIKKGSTEPYSPNPRLDYSPQLLGMFDRLRVDRCYRENGSSRLVRALAPRLRTKPSPAAIQRTREVE